MKQVPPYISLFFMLFSPLCAQGKMTFAEQLGISSLLLSSASNQESDKEIEAIIENIVTPPTVLHAGTKLLKPGAALRAIDKEGNTFLHGLCVRENPCHLIKRFTDYDVFLNSPWGISVTDMENKQKINPLTLAICSLRHSKKVLADIIDIFSLRWDGINARNSIGNTPLHYFMQLYGDTIFCENEWRTLTVLRNSGARLYVKNDIKKTPLDFITDETTKETIREFWKPHYKISEYKTPPQSPKNSKFEWVNRIITAVFFGD